MKDRTPEDQRLLEMIKNKKSARSFGYFRRLNELAPKSIPVHWSELTNVDPPPTEQEWASLCSLIGLTTANRKTMQDPVEVRQHPLFVLPKGKVILSDISNGLDVLWDRFEVVARNDPSFYDRRYQRRKASWLEKKVGDLFERVFPQKHIYKKLSYPDPDKSDSSTAELDIAIKWGPFLVLVEAKARQFRMESQLGDLGRLRTDLKANIEDAFEQARRAVRYIEQIETPKFTERTTGRVLTFRSDEIRRTYLLTISQHHLAHLANRFALFEFLGLFKDKEYPLALCVADLDTISEFCDGPDVLLHYIERRLDIHRQSFEMMSDALELFGAYLDTRLQADRLWAQDGKPVDGFALTGWQGKFDKWMHYKRGDLKDPPDIKLQVPVEIERILGELRRRTNDDAARWIAFSLLDMSDAGLKAIDQMIREVKDARLTSGMFRRVTHQEKETVISIVASLDLPPQMLRERTNLRATVEKYRRKASKSIGIGIMVADASKPFDCAVWLEGDWQYDEKMEALVKSEPGFIPIPGQKLPGRNDTCLCGSGVKYKRCCMAKIEAARRKTDKSSPTS